MVNVMGNLKLLRMTLPVLEETAEVAYHKVQRRTNLIVEGEGSGDWKSRLI